MASYQSPPTSPSTLPSSTPSSPLSSPLRSPSLSPPPSSQLEEKRKGEINSIHTEGIIVALQKENQQLKESLARLEDEWKRRSEESEQYWNVKLQEKENWIQEQEENQDKEKKELISEQERIHEDRERLLQDEIEIFRDRVEDLELKLKQEEKRHELELEDLIQEKEDEMGVTHRQSETKQKKIEELEESISSLQESLSISQGTNTSLQNKNEQQQKAIASLKTTLEEREAELSRAVSLQSSVVQKMQSMFENEAGKNATKNERVSLLSQEKNRLLDLLEVSKQKEEQMKVELNEKDTVIQWLQRRLEKIGKPQPDSRDFREMKESSSSHLDEKKKRGVARSLGDVSHHQLKKDEQKNEGKVDRDLLLVKNEVVHFQKFIQEMRGSLSQLKEQVIFLLVLCVRVFLF